MYFFLCFCALVLLSGTEGGQNCVFPCDWHNKEFAMIFFGATVTHWNFSASGTTFFSNGTNGVVTYDCFQIFGHFIIARNQDTDEILCIAVKVQNPDSFTSIGGIVLTTNHTDICKVCSGNAPTLHLSANPAPVDCVIPVECPPIDGEISCTDNGSLDIGNCIEPPKRCRQKHNKP